MLSHSGIDNISVYMLSTLSLIRERGVNDNKVDDNKALITLITNSAGPGD